MTWAAAFALGAVISPPDAVAAVAIAERLGVPRRIVTILEGESLLWTDLDRWRRRLLASPWVRDAELRRSLS